MNKKELEELFIRSFEDLKPDLLDLIDDDKDYSYRSKTDFLKFISDCQSELKAKGVISLSSYKSNCPHCYPNSNAYSFYDKMTNEFIIRFVIHQNSPDSYIIDECKNNPIPDGENGLPF